MRLSQFDTRAGALIERLVRVHHHRRLSRIGHAGVLAPDGGWARGDLPPRRDNAFDVLVDGAAALTRDRRAIEGAR